MKSHNPKELNTIPSRKPKKFVLSAYKTAQDKADDYGLTISGMTEDTLDSFTTTFKAKGYKVFEIHLQTPYYSEGK